MKSRSMTNGSIVSWLLTPKAGILLVYQDWNVLFKVT